jgi:hypothetical protein
MITEETKTTTEATGDKLLKLGQKILGASHPPVLEPARVNANSFCVSLAFWVDAFVEQAKLCSEEQNLGYFIDLRAIARDLINDLQRQEFIK